jgi:hypothetical protein
MVKADGSRVWRRFAKDEGEIAQLAQILGQLEELKGTLLLHANEDCAPAETIAQLHMLVQQAIRFCRRWSRAKTPIRRLLRLRPARR